MSTPGPQRVGGELLAQVPTPSLFPIQDPGRVSPQKVGTSRRGPEASNGRLCQAAGEAEAREASMACTCVCVCVYGGGAPGMCVHVCAVCKEEWW